MGGSASTVKSNDKSDERLSAGYAMGGAANEVLSVPTGAIAIAINYVFDLLQTRPLRPAPISTTVLVQYSDPAQPEEGRPKNLFEELITDRTVRQSSGDDYAQREENARKTHSGRQSFRDDSEQLREEGPRKGQPIDDPFSRVRQNFRDDYAREEGQRKYQPMVDNPVSDRRARPRDDLMQRETVPRRSQAMLEEDISDRGVCLLPRRDYSQRTEERKEFTRSRSQNHDEIVIKKIRADAVKKLGLDTVNCYNVAISGQAGAGKSTVVNFFCGYRENDPRAAPVDIIECTNIINKFQCPKMKHLVLWDCPGANTADHPAKTYFNDKMLFAFDFLIVLYSEGFKEIDANLIKDAAKFNIPVACVRNKANLDLQAKKRLKEFKNRSIEDIKASLTKELRNEALEAMEYMRIPNPPPLFIINAWALDDQEHQPAFEEAELIKHVGRVMYSRRNDNN